MGKTYKSFCQRHQEENHCTEGELERMLSVDPESKISSKWERFREGEEKRKEKGRGERRQKRGKGRVEEEGGYKAF